MSAHTTAGELKEKVMQLPQAGLGHFPTPLDFCPTLSDELGICLYIKRDDCTGLGFGGNKVRQLRFSYGEALDSGADCIVQGAASQSNHCRQAAAAAAQLGLDCFLALREDEHSAEGQGNLLLDRLFNAKIEFFDAPMGEGMNAAKHSLADRLKSEGRRPYLLAPPQSLKCGAIAFVDAFLELIQQAEDTGISLDHLFVCSCGGTAAGLFLANQALRAYVGITAIAPILWDWPTSQRICEAANLAAEALELELRLKESDLQYSDDYVGPGYGIPSDDGLAALELLAAKEGILLDPVYTSKAFAALLHAVRAREVPQGETVIFWHTGGTPALFAYREELGL